LDTHVNLLLNNLFFYYDLFMGIAWPTTKTVGKTLPILQIILDSLARHSLLARGESATAAGS
jgi:hypothetical protein